MKISYKKDIEKINNRWKLGKFCNLIDKDYLKNSWRLIFKKGKIYYKNE